MYYCEEYYGVIVEREIKQCFKSGIIHNVEGGQILLNAMTI